MKKTLDWDHLRIFLMAMRTGSFRKAAERLGVNHGTVHRAISALETDLGARVFDRTTSGLRLTQSGESLIGPAEEMEAQANSISRKLFGLDLKPSGTIRLSLPPALSHGLLSDMLCGFTEAYPEISVHTIATNRISDLRRLEADVSLRVARTVDEDVYGRKLVKFVQAVFASPGYLKRHPDLLGSQGMGAHWIAWSEHQDWVAVSPFPKAAVRHVLPEISMQIEAAAKGLGLIKIPAFAGDVDPRIVRVPDVPVQSGYDIWILYHGDLRRVARVRAFADFAIDYFKRNSTLFTA
ncbi:LysR family transcriptional regulator [Roseibium sediminicola]|uniref:LysR family transcriptional regulator n=1 Tax=Roseibium sediminicola TaxID=2933272 RepID=A0ABT0GUY4_9HYPH|nr:LysR family transcriptional regulator [Roseibium sp. CAU 1639]MCK7613238.1 LysR family transcriptional regulator [Roseibium sp. CAU 1639]